MLAVSPLHVCPHKTSHSHSIRHSKLLCAVLQAALCCEPLPAAAREELAAALQGLPQKQLEAALGLVLPRLMAAGDSHLTQQHSKAAGVSQHSILACALVTWCCFGLS
jgi:hypothetical protein